VIAAPVPVVVVPCFNEEQRLDTEAFLALARSDRMRLLFVDDGSTDATPRVLEHLASRHRALDVLLLARNAGKAEAVRQGMLRALAEGAEVVGYFDADLATPPSELLRLVDVAERRPELAGVFGCRVARLGAAIDRSALRHYLGRVFATLASASLRVPVYDTQCGAKLFRVGDGLRAALARPFRSPWSFDVELLGRLLGAEGSAGDSAIGVDDFVEVPLEAWQDVPGSKLSLRAAAAALVALAVVARDRRRSPAPRRPMAHRPVVEPATVVPLRRGTPGPNDLINYEVSVLANGDPARRGRSAPRRAWKGP
jgi:dolichyl-phosphate beta-glucosyltransferase